MQTTCIHHTAVTACVSVVNLQLEAQLTCCDAYIHVGSVYDFGQRPATINSMELHDIYSTLLKVKPVGKASLHQTTQFICLR